MDLVIVPNCLVISITKVTHTVILWFLKRERDFANVSDRLSRLSLKLLSVHRFTTALKRSKKAIKRSETVMRRMESLDKAKNVNF